MQSAPPPPPPPPSTAPAASACPSCGKLVSPTDKFCPSCGSTIQVTGAPPTTTASGAPPDIRSRVEGDRGALKKLQLLIPGFRAYRQGEDIRAADAILRIQVADRLAAAMQHVDAIRSDMAREGVFASLSDLGGLRSELQRMEGQIRHAEQGYTGISPAIRISPEKLDRLYERDWSFLSAADTVSSSIAPIEQAVAAKNGPQVTTLVNQLRQSMRDLENNFAHRILDIEKILQ